MKRAILSPVLVLAAAFLGAGCVEERPLEQQVGSFHIAVAGNAGSAEAPLAFPEAEVSYALQVEARANTGGVLESFSGPVTLYTAPGRTTKNGRPATVRIDLVNGRGQGQVSARGLFGRSHVCAVDDARGAESTYVRGCSGTLWYRMPSLRQIQKVADVEADASPLAGSFLEVRAGDLMVTHVTNDGFYLSDLEAEPQDGLPGSFGHLFVFNYSYPEDLQVGDRLESVIGTVTEFTGSTQITFPAWVRRTGKPVVEDLPVPTPLTPATCAATGQMCGADPNMALESLEAALVALEARTPTRWADCDVNQDGTVPNYVSSCETDPIGCEELVCKTECNEDPGCSELSGFLVYGQWAVALNDGAGPKVNVITRGANPEFDPTEEANLGVPIEVVGTLRQAYPARPPWIVVARTAEDVTLHP